MSKAFLKETDDEWLNEIQPTLYALTHFLTRENQGIRVYEVRSYVVPGTGTEIHEMSNGLSYALDGANKWQVVL